MSNTEIKNFPDYDSFMKCLGLEFKSKSSMCQGRRVVLVYANEKMTVIAHIDKKRFLEGVIFEKTKKE